MSLDLGEYAHLRGVGSFAFGNVPAFAGISFGRSSALLGGLLDERTTFCFENTGREHIASLDYGRRLEDAYQREIVWLEWRPAPRLGDAPKMFRFERVTYATAVKRSNDLIAALLDSLNAYRRTQDLPPLTPWARSRLCTAYLKHRTQRKYIESLLGQDAAYDSIVGLRHDEQDRIQQLMKSQTAKRSYSCPLDPAGITKPMVNAFWSRQSFDLELEHDYQGNCTGCFLKDEADLSRALGEEETDADGWIALQERFPGFGGRSKPPYSQLLAEREIRLKMEAYWKGETVFAPLNNGTMTPRRFHLVMLQEKRRAKEGVQPFSCSCEGSIALADDDAELESTP